QLVAVDLAGAVGADELVPDVLAHQARIAATWVAIAGAAGGSNANHVAFIHFERGHDGVRLDAAVGADHFRVVGRSFTAAGEPPRRVAVARVRAGEEAAVGAHAVVEDDAFAAAVLALAARLVVERKLVDVQPVTRLGDLGRAIERVAVEAAELGSVAVASCA